MPKEIKLTLSDEETEEIELLIALCGLKSWEEFFNEAATVFRWAVYETMEGANISSVYDKRELIRIIKRPVFDHLTKRANSIKP